jgi:hypothetical protein
MFDLTVNVFLLEAEDIVNLRENDNAIYFTAKFNWLKDKKLSI